MTTLLIVFFVLLFIVAIVALVRSSSMRWYDDGVDEEIVTTTTTTTTTTTDGVGVTNNYTGLNINGFPVVGMLTRLFDDNRQPYVIDPVDGVKWMLNTSDDIYEDAAGKWWGLQ